jgi:hypothetical protein
MKRIVLLFVAFVLLGSVSVSAQWVRPLCEDLQFCFVVQNISYFAEEDYIYLDSDTFRMNETILNATIDDRAVAGGADGGIHTDQALNTTSNVTFENMSVNIIYSNNLSGAISCTDIYGSPDTDFCTDADTVSTSWTYTNYFNQSLNTADSPTFHNLTIEGNLTAQSGRFEWVDKLEITEPPTPPANTLRLFVVEQDGFSRYNYKDEYGITRTINDDEIIVNNTRGSTIAAHRLVYVTGHYEGVPTIDLAQANDTATMPVICVTIESIADNAFGRCMMTGLIQNVNTNAFDVGTIYVSDLTAGVPTNTAPITPNLTQEIGTILVKSATVGEIQIIARALTGDEYGTINNYIVQGNLSALGSTHYFFGSVNATNLSGALSCTDIYGSPDADFCTDADSGAVGDGGVHTDQSLNTTSNVTFYNLVLNNLTVQNVSANMCSATNLSGALSCSDIYGEDSNFCVDSDTNLTIDDIGGMGFFNTTTNISDLGYVLGSHTNRTDAEIFALINNGSYALPVNITTANSSMKVYVDAQDSAQDECGEITNCVPNAAAGNLTSNNNLTIIGNISANIVYVNNLSGNISCTDIYGSPDTDFCTDATGVGAADGGTHTDQFLNTTSNVTFYNLVLNNLTTQNVSSNIVYANNLSGNISCTDIYGSPDTDFCTDATGAGVADGGVHTDQFLNTTSNVTFYNLDLNNLTVLNISANACFATNLSGALSCTDIYGTDSNFCVDADTNLTIDDVGAMGFFNSSQNVTDLGVSLGTHTNLTIDDVGGMGFFNSSTNITDLGFALGTHTNRTDDDIFALINNRSYALPVNITTANSSMKVYVDAQDSAQDECSEITNCVPSAAAGNVTSNSNITIVGNVSADILFGTNLSGQLSCSDIYGADADFCNDATGGGGDGGIHTDQALNITNTVTFAEGNMTGNFTVGGNISVGGKIIYHNGSGLCIMRC